MRLAILLLLLAISAPANDLFTAGEGGYALYRIPGLVVTSQGSLLAYAEARVRKTSDWGAIDIVLRRSTDGGRTFSPPRKIANVPGPHAKNPVALAQKLGTENEVTYNNPVAIADKKPGVVHFVFCLEYMRAFYMRSDDDGLTFSEPKEITAAFQSLQSKYPFKVIATGPGHGIQLKNGRLLIPIWISPGTGGQAHRPSVTATLYSDNRGATWHASEIAVPDTPEFAIPNETTAAQLPNGQVLLNVRSESKAHRRILVSSKNGVTKWSKPVFADDLLEPICFGSMVTHGKRLLFTNPTTLNERRNLTLHISTDNGNTWPTHQVLDPGLAGYSDLAVGPDGSIYCLYERGGSRFLTLLKL